MRPQLINCAKTERESFNLEALIPSEHILAIVYEGSFLVTEDGKSFTVSSAEGFLFRKGVLYERRVLSPVTLFLFRFFDDVISLPRQTVRFLDRERLLSTCRLLDATFSMSTDSFTYWESLFSDILTQYAIENAQAPISCAGDKRINGAIEYIKLHYDSKLSLYSLADSLSLSYAQFHRLFKKQLGTTPERYLIGIRMEKARELLSSTDLSVERISYSCGFENCYYFSLAFKKHTNLSPTAYRKQHRTYR